MSRLSRTGGWCRGVLGCALVLFHATAGSAQEADGAARAAPPRPPEAPAPSSTSDDAEDGHRLRWTFPRFRVWEAVASGLATSTSVVVETTTKDFRDSTWNGGILFDDWVRDTLVAQSFSSRRRAAEISDVMWPITQYMPVVDSLVTPLLTDGFNVDVAVQQSLINWQVLGSTHLVVRLLQHAAGRARPSLSECGDNPHYDGACSPTATGRTASFVSGHTAMSFAAAMLSCSHHGALPMYGGNLADAAMCALMVSSATTVGVLRIVADRHWPTDVLAGAAVGIAMGYGLPQLLHYAHDSSERDSSASLVRHWAVMPMVSEQVLGAGVMGAL